MSLAVRPFFLGILLVAKSATVVFACQELESQQQIVESLCINDVRKYIEPGTLVVFDYDNVLIEGKQDYGFGDWFYTVWMALQKGGLSKDDALNALVPIYVQIQSTAEVQLVEESSRQLLYDVKNAGCPVLILTTRGTEMVDICVRQLQSVGIDIEQFALPDNGLNELLGSVSIYCKGILFGSRGIKGRALKLFLQSHEELCLKKVIFINDKKRYLEEARDAVIDVGIQFVGIRYGSTDTRSRAYVLDDESALLVQKILSFHCIEFGLNKTGSADCP